MQVEPPEPSPSAKRPSGPALPEESSSSVPIELGAAPPGWWRALRRLYDRLDRELEPHRDLCQVRGICCDFRSAEHRLYATDFEVAFALASARGNGVGERAGRLPDGELRLEESSPLCPFWVDGLCRARSIRPLGCRTYFCDESWRARGEGIHARYHAELRELSEVWGLPYRYRPWVQALRDPPSPPPE